MKMYLFKIIFNLNIFAVEGADLIDDLQYHAFKLEAQQADDSVFTYHKEICEGNEAKFLLMAWVQTKKAKHNGKSLSASMKIEFICTQIKSDYNSDVFGRNP